MWNFRLHPDRYIHSSHRRWGFKSGIWYVFLNVTKMDNGLLDTMDVRMHRHRMHGRKNSRWRTQYYILQRCYSSFKFRNRGREQVKSGIHARPSKIQPMCCNITVYSRSPIKLCIVKYAKSSMYYIVDNVASQNTYSKIKSVIIVPIARWQVPLVRRRPKDVVSRRL